MKDHLTIDDPTEVNIETKFLVKPSNSIDIEQIKVAIIMYGLRLPKRDFELSAMTPGRIQTCCKLGSFYIHAPIIG